VALLEWRHQQSVLPLLHEEKIMKYALFAALSMFSLFASAADSGKGLTQGNTATPVVEYNYSQTLDVAKVISLSSDSSSRCKPVQANMIYLDSQGVRHNLEYLRLSEICEIL
jgi:hypothetical protein